MFADDVKLISPSSESAVLQRDIHAIHPWTQEWDLPLNENKCSTISVGQSPTNPFTLYLGGPAIKDAETTMDLEVHVDRNFKPSRLCVLAAQRARAALFLIVGTFARLIPRISFSYSLVRPDLEYAIQATCHYLKKDVDYVERVQRLATSIAAFLPYYCVTLSDLHGL